MDEQLIIKAFEHIEVINGEIGNIEVNIAVLQTQIATLLRWHWLVVTSVVGIVIIQAAQLVQMRKNNKK